MIDLEVFVADEQDDVAIDTTVWAQFVRSVLLAEGVKAPAEVSVLFVDEAAMSALHERFLGLSGPTDVLSFPLDGEFFAKTTAATGPVGHPKWRDDDVDEALEEMPLALGDVIVCPSVAYRQAPQHAGSFDDEVALLLVHGALHLLGHDHAQVAEREVMQARERALLGTCWRPLPRDPWAEPFAAAESEQPGAVGDRDGEQEAGV